jgi:hypothetical protein
VILLFDEADALFGKRSEVKDSHDATRILKSVTCSSRWRHIAVSRSSRRTRGAHWTRRFSGAFVS